MSTVGARAMVAVAVTRPSKRSRGSRSYSAMKASSGSRSGSFRGPVGCALTPARRVVLLRVLAQVCNPTAVTVDPRVLAPCLREYGRAFRPNIKVRYGYKSICICALAPR